MMLRTMRQEGPQLTDGPPKANQPRRTRQCTDTSRATNEKYYTGASQEQELNENHAPRSRSRAVQKCFCTRSCSVINQGDRDTVSSGQTLFGIYAVLHMFLEEHPIGPAT